MPELSNVEYQQYIQLIDLILKERNEFDCDQVQLQNEANHVLIQSEVSVIEGIDQENINELNSLSIVGLKEIKGDLSNSILHTEFATFTTDKLLKIREIYLKKLENMI